MRFLTSSLARCLPVAAATALCLAGATTTAQAAPPTPASPPSTSADATGPITVTDTSCAGGDLCFWVNINKGGAKGRVSGNNDYWTWPQTQCQEGTWSNCASSIWNNGNTCDVWVFDFFQRQGANPVHPAG